MLFLNSLFSFVAWTYIIVRDTSLLLCSNWLLLLSTTILNCWSIGLAAPQSVVGWEKEGASLAAGCNFWACPCSGEAAGFWCWFGEVQAWSAFIISFHLFYCLSCKFFLSALPHSTHRTPKHTYTLVLSVFS